MDFDSQVKVSVYRHFADTGEAPSTVDIAGRLGCTGAEVVDAFTRLRLQRVLLLEADGETIRMAPPFSGVPTPHRVESVGRTYFANCAWDALGIPAALHREAVVYSELRADRSRRSASRSGRAGQSPADGSSIARSRGALVGGPGLHLKHHALLPVGRTGNAMVRRAGDRRRGRS